MFETFSLLEFSFGLGLRPNARTRRKYIRSMRLGLLSLAYEADTTHIEYRQTGVLVTCGRRSWAPHGSADGHDEEPQDGVPRLSKHARFILRAF
jgi:hypothetical protein